MKKSKLKNAQQNGMFKEYYKFELEFENGDAGNIYKKADSSGLTLGEEYEYTINDKSVSKLKAKSDLDIDTVKTNEISIVKSSQNSILSSTDWYYIRKTDKGTAIPTDVQNYRDAVRTAGDKMITDITAVSDKVGFQALYPVWNEDKENTGGTLNVWPDPADYNL